MILYCDTSALIKRYVEEDGTEEIDKLWQSSNFIASSIVSYAETVATFRRKWREGIFSDRAFKETVDKFREDYSSLILVPVTNELNSTIEMLLERYPLKGFDAIHLASALIFKKSGFNLFFACFDRILNKAAENEGLLIIKAI